MARNDSTEQRMAEIAKMQEELDARRRELASINVGLLGDSTGFVDSQFTWRRCKVEQRISELETRLKTWSVADAGVVL